MIREAMHGWLEIALEDGLPIPEPRELEQYSGKFVVRVPRWLHRELVRTTGQEGVSLNQFVSTVLARAVGEQVAASAHAAMRAEATAETAARLEAARLVLESLTASLMSGDATDALRLAGAMAPLLQSNRPASAPPDARPQVAAPVTRTVRKVRPAPAPVSLSYGIPHAAGVLALADRAPDLPTPEDALPS